MKKEGWPAAHRVMDAQYQSPQIAIQRVSPGHRNRNLLERLFHHNRLAAQSTSQDQYILCIGATALNMLVIHHYITYLCARLRP